MPYIQLPGHKPMANTVQTGRIASMRVLFQTLAPGLTVSVIVAVAASFLAGHYEAPVMLFALLLGMAVNFLSDDGKCKQGIEFTAREILRVGVALLGIRITFDQIAALGWEPVALVVGSVVATILVSIAAARALGFPAIFGVLTGGATAICGASAALAGIMIGGRGGVSILAGTGLEMQTIAAAVLGGTILLGGRGSIPAAMAGALALELLFTLLNLMGLPKPLRDAVQGLIIIGAVAYTAYSSRRSQ